jgi:8-oxo-dGTP pyrophosphatase MutT (NUDIX family)
LWHQRQVLLVAASYRNELSLPGGWINRGETARLAAQRELAEELGVDVAANELGEPWAFTERSARGVNNVTIFSVELTERPALQVDGLEILSCLWLTRTEALEHPITGHLREYLLEKPNP